MSPNCVKITNDLMLLIQWSILSILNITWHHSLVALCWKCFLPLVSTNALFPAFPSNRGQLTSKFRAPHPHFSSGSPAAAWTTYCSPLGRSPQGFECGCGLPALPPLHLYPSKSWMHEISHELWIPSFIPRYEEDPVLLCCLHTVTLTLA